MRLLFCFSLALLANFVNAAEITYSYIGQISRMYEATCIANGSNGCNGYDINDKNSSSFYLNNTFAVGDVFSGFFTYDTEAQLSAVSGDGYQSIYSNGIVDYGLAINAYNTPSLFLPDIGSNSLSIVNGRYGIDNFQAGIRSINSEWFNSITLSLQDNTDAVFTNQSIPVSLNPNDFHHLGFQTAFLNRNTRDQLQIRGNISNIFLVSVPSPSTLFLFTTGLLSLLFMSNKSISMLKKIGLSNINRKTLRVPSEVQQ